MQKAVSKFLVSRLWPSGYFGLENLLSCFADSDNWYDCELVKFDSSYSVFEYSFWTYTKLVPNKVPKNFVQGKI